MGLFDFLKKPQAQQPADVSQPPEPSPVVFDPAPQEARCPEGPDAWTFIDVETPNRHNDRICSIGIVRTDNLGEIVDEQYHLVNPEARFDELNMHIHGISKTDVARAKTFPELWDDVLRDMLSGAGIVAHNARFDLSVIWKSVEAYGLEHPDIDYACTMNMARSSKKVKGGSYKLPDVCAELGIDFDNHHNAAADAEASMQVFWALIGKSLKRPRLERYEYGARVRHGSTGGRGRKVSDSAQAMRDLMAMLEASLSDDTVELDEALAILECINRQPQWANDPAISSLADMLERFVMDGFIDDEEQAKLCHAFRRALNPAEEKAEETVEFEGKSFCLTGTFDHGSRDEVEGYIANRGGIPLKSVTKKCNYVVIGNGGSEAYALGNYGTKVKKAMDWQAKGVDMKIIGEDDLFKGE